MRVVVDILHREGDVARSDHKARAFLTAYSRGQLLSILTANQAGSMFVTVKIPNQSGTIGARDLHASLSQGVIHLRNDPRCPPLLLEHLERATQALLSSGSHRSSRSRWLTPTQLKIAKEELSSRLSQVITIADVASACGISRGHLNRGFRQMVGMAPMRWRMEVRLNLCRRLLMETDQLVADIAKTAGFQDACYFSRAFTLTSGMNPRDWRRLFRIGRIATTDHVT